MYKHEWKRYICPNCKKEGVVGITWGLKEIIFRYYYHRSGHLSLKKVIDDNPSLQNKPIFETIKKYFDLNNVINLVMNDKSVFEEMISELHKKGVPVNNRVEQCINMKCKKIYLVEDLDLYVTDETLKAWEREKERERKQKLNEKEKKR